MVLWSGDFSTGNLKQWSGYEAVDASRLQVLDAPGRPGTKALKATVRHDVLVHNGYRAEVVREPEGREGEERWYSWSTLFPADFVSPGQWQVFTQWHQGYVNGASVGSSPPIAFTLSGEKMQLDWNNATGTEKVLWSAPLVRNSWQDFLFHVKWSSNPSIGFVELSLNGKLVLPKLAIATMFAGFPNYLKQGLYRSRDILPEASVWHQGMKIHDAAPATSSVPVPAPAPIHAPAPTPTVAASPLRVVVTMSDGRSIVFKPE